MSRPDKSIHKIRRLMRKDPSSETESVGAQKRICLFCETDQEDELNLGKFYQKGDITVHYFCLLLSSGLFQRTKVSDKSSILGFSPCDIIKEIKRGKQLTCSYCLKKGATIGCCGRKCSKKFHLTCGLKNGVLSQFFDNYRSYCVDHRDTQAQVKKLSRDKTKKKCSICLCKITFTPLSLKSLVCPSCRHSYFHRACIQQYAISAGMHFFKCPLCNEMDTFQEEMLEFGIYIPDQDASWEREPNAYQELLERHSTCDARICRCPFGRTHDADSGKYELLLCSCCGSAGSHRACNGLTPKEDVLLCKDCYEILDAVESSTKKGKGLHPGTNSDSSTSQPSHTHGIVGRRKRPLSDKACLDLSGECISQGLNTCPMLRGKINMGSPKRGCQVYISKDFFCLSRKMNKCPFCCSVFLTRADCVPKVSPKTHSISSSPPAKLQRAIFEQFGDQSPPQLVDMSELEATSDNERADPPVLIYEGECGISVTTDHQGVNPLATKL